jgi:signal transduction histidine kinase/ABC-type amino acid transport substrate-binding protein
MRILLLTALLWTLTTTVSAQQRVYDAEHPLVYEDAWDLWPYAFLNEQGEPEGFNIDLIRLVMEELRIPYVIRLKPAAEAISDLRQGKSDLTFCVVAGYNEDGGPYSTDALTLFTQSVVTPKSKPLEIKNFRDLGKHRVIVNDSSLCHHMMIDYGWEHNAEPMEDMREAIQKVSATEEGQIVWNTLSLQWLMRRYHIDNLELTPVNMPHGEYKFMSNDLWLLEKLDQTYSQLYSTERITPIQNKWFYPVPKQKKIPTWLWYFTATALLLLVIATSYTISYRVQARRLRDDNKKLNKRLALIMETSQVRVWTYDTTTEEFTWRNENGMAAYVYPKEEFAQRYSTADFQRLMEAISRLASQKVRPAADADEEEVTLQMKARDMEDGDDEWRDFIITLSVLRRRKDGTPMTIIGTKKDITQDLVRLREVDEQAMRYQAVLNHNTMSILFFDRDGFLVNINPKACELFACEHDAAVAAHQHISQVLGLDDRPLRETDGYWATLLLKGDRRYIDYRLATVSDDRGELLGVFAICRDVTDYAAVIRRQQQLAAALDTLGERLSEYQEDIDAVLSQNDLRLVKYSPDTHTLTVYRRADVVQHSLTQTRCMTLVDDHHKKQAMRLLADMDGRQDHPIDTTISTTLRVRGGYRLFLQFSLTPRHDDQGHVSEYIGLCRDLSELHDIEQRTEQQLAKVLEVENTKNSFVKNMVQEIRQPMDTVVDYVSRLNPTTATADEALLTQGIMDNADRLLHLIDNILYLSRLEAHMVEIKASTVNFAELFEAFCNNGWSKFKTPTTRYIVENPYDQLLTDIDSQHVGHVIQQLTANAAQHTFSGAVRARYDYIGRRLIIAIEDSGEGIPAEEVERLNSGTHADTQNMKGLGLAICQELVSQMNGTLEVSSERGSSTTVYVTIPCQATSIKRKKIV